MQSDQDYHFVIYNTKCKVVPYFVAFYNVFLLIKWPKQHPHFSAV